MAAAGAGGVGAGSKVTTPGAEALAARLPMPIEAWTSLDGAAAADDVSDAHSDDVDGKGEGEGGEEVDATDLEPRVALERNKPLSESMLFSLQRAFYEEHAVDAWAKNLVPNYITTNNFIAERYAAIIVGYWEDLFFRPMTATGDAAGAGTPAGGSSKQGPGAAAAPLDLSAPLYLVEMGSGSGRFAYFLVKALRRRLRRRPHLRHLKWCYVLTDFVDKNVDSWFSHPVLKPMFDAGEMDCCRYDAQEAYAPLKLRYSGKTLHPGTLANPPILISNYTFCVIEMDAFKVTPDGKVYEALVTTTAPESLAALKPLPATALPKTKSSFYTAPEPLPVRTVTDPRTGHRLREVVRYGEGDVKELNFVLEFYRQAFAGIHTAQATTHAGAAPPEEGEDAPDFAYTPLVLPSASARCMDAVSKLYKHGRAMLCLVSDKGYTKQRELPDCDAFSISHEGSFSLMVNMQALGVLCKCFGGYALHTGQTVAEQGDTCLATSAFIIDERLQGPGMAMPPLDIEAAARARGAPVDHFDFDVDFNFRNSLACWQRLKELVQNLRDSTEDLYAVVHADGTSGRPCYHEDETQFALCFGSGPGYAAAFTHITAAFQEGIDTLSPTDFFRLMHGMDGRLVGTTYTSEESDPDIDPETAKMPNLQQVLGLLRMSNWDSACVMHCLDTLLALLELATAEERLAVARGLVFAFKNLLFIGEEEDVAFDFGRCFYQMQIPGHELALTFYFTSQARLGEHNITCYNIGLCFKEARQPARAAEYFRRSIELDDSYEPAHESLQEVLDKLAEEAAAGGKAGAGEAAGAGIGATALPGSGAGAGAGAAGVEARPVPSVAP